MARRGEAGVKQRIGARSGEINHATPPRMMEIAKTGAADRTSTCIVPLRRRMPHVFDHGSNLKLVGMAGFGLPKPYEMDAPSVDVRCREP